MGTGHRLQERKRTTGVSKKSKGRGWERQQTLKSKEESRKLSSEDTGLRREAEMERLGRKDYSKPRPCTGPGPISVDVGTGGMGRGMVMEMGKEDGRRKGRLGEGRIRGGTHPRSGEEPRGVSGDRERKWGETRERGGGKNGIHPKGEGTGQARHGGEQRKERGGDSKFGLGELEEAGIAAEGKEGAAARERRKARFSIEALDWRRTEGTQG